MSIELKLVMCIAECIFSPIPLDSYLFVGKKSCQELSWQYFAFFNIYYSTKPDLLLVIFVLTSWTG